MSDKEMQTVAKKLFMGITVGLPIALVIVVLAEGWLTAIACFVFFYVGMFFKDLYLRFGDDGKWGE